MSRFRWMLTTGLVILLGLLGLARIRGRRVPVGQSLGLVSDSCSVELMQRPVPPLRIRLLSNHDLRFGADILSQQRARDILSVIGQTRPDHLVLLDADDDLTFEETVGFFDQVHSYVPTWKLLLITPQTRSACQRLIEARSFPAD